MFNDDRGVDLEVAQGCFRHIERIFEALNDIRPFELLPSSYDRTNYLVTTQAKIIAMTCTHASLKVRERKSGVAATVKHRVHQ